MVITCPACRNRYEDYKQGWAIKCSNCGTEWIVGGNKSTQKKKRQLKRRKIKRLDKELSLNPFPSHMKDVIAVIPLEAFLAESYNNNVTTNRKWKSFRRNGFVCAYCGLVGTVVIIYYSKQKTDNVIYGVYGKSNDNNSTYVELTMDHVIAIANGGTDALANTQTLCASCNHAKGSKKI